ncbi:MAG: pitrilysin family protein [Myxococcota bacterium]
MRRDAARRLVALVLAALFFTACERLGETLAPGDAGSTGYTPAWELPPPPAPDATVVQPGALRRTTLDNGLHILVLEDHRLPRVVLGISVRRGAASVERGQAGLASFTAELMQRGAGKRDALALAEAVDEIGASLNVSAGWDSITVGVSGLTRDLDRLAQVLADVTLRPRFEEKEASKVRAEQLARLRQAQDDPGTLVQWHVARVLYPAHRYGQPLSGAPESVGKLAADSARAFHESVFLPNNAILFASGDLSTADWLRRASRLFDPGDWRPGEIPPPAPPPAKRTPESRRLVVVDRPDLEQAHIVIAHEGIHRAHPKRLAVDLMNKVLGGSGFSSRLMTRLRADQGLTYGVWSGFSLRRHPGPFRVSTSTRVAETRRALDLALDELEGIRTRPPIEEELSKAASYSVGRFGLGLETSAAVMASLVDLDVYHLPEDSLDTYRSRIRAVDTQAVAEAARERLDPPRAAIVILGPAEAIVPQLDGLGTPEIVKPSF